MKPNPTLIRILFYFILIIKLLSSSWCCDSPPVPFYSHSFSLTPNTVESGRNVYQGYFEKVSFLEAQNVVVECVCF